MPAAVSQEQSAKRVVNVWVNRGTAAVSNLALSEAERKRRIEWLAKLLASGGCIYFPKDCSLHRLLTRPKQELIWGIDWCSK